MKNRTSTALHTILAASLMATLALAGCEVGPDYEKPQTALPADWTASEAQVTVNDKDAIDQQWWDNFHDPVLSQLIARANDNNPDLQIAEARIAQARSQEDAAFAALLPRADIKGTATREANQVAFPGSNTPGSLGPLLKKPYNIFQTGFDASWELDLFGGNRRAEEAATARMQASEASRDDALVSLMAEVARSYVDIRQYQAQIAITQDTIASNQKTVDIARQRFKAGDTAGIDVTQAESALQAAKTQLPQIRTQLAQAEFSMDVLVGEQPGAAHALVAQRQDIPVSDKKLVMAAPAAVIAQRPDIRIAERKLAAATAQQGQAVAKFFPDISLSGFFGSLSTQGTNLLRGSSESWLGSASMIWPILDYGALSSNLDAANAQQQEAMANYRKTMISALSDVEKSLTAWQEQQKFLQSATIQVEKDTQARDIEMQRYRSGLTSFIDVLDADRTLYMSQQQLVKARADASSDLIALYKSLGGGWVKQAKN
jgi:NodT family efflux transporter outer membrane factor (OMF) lipoprotein